jgi:hypothetical protein
MAARKTPAPRRPDPRSRRPFQFPVGRTTKVPVPAMFQPDRSRPPGRHPLLEVFQGLEKTPPFRKYPGDDAEVLAIAKRTYAHISEGPGWMYVAPRRTPKEVRAAGFRMVESRDDTIVVASEHLAKSPTMDLYLDVIHEFLHILQRKHGRELWPSRYAYVDRPTEVEAYFFSVVEARRLGIDDGFLRDYLQVPWAPRGHAVRLLENLGVTPPKASKARAK